MIEEDFLIDQPFGQKNLLEAFRVHESIDEDVRIDEFLKHSFSGFQYPGISRR